MKFNLTGKMAMLVEQLREARVHVVRQQHDGSHEQNRYDAREWLKQFGEKPCCCKRCLRLEGRADLASVAGDVPESG